MGQATIETLLRLHGEVALVTGAASGIGRGVAHRLAQAGASVALLDIDTAGGERAAREIGQSTGAPTLFVSCDVSSAQGCERAVRQAVERFGYIDVLVNNAGVIRRKNVVDLLEAEWDLVVDVSLKGAYLMSKHVIPCMRPDRGGSIVNMGSGWGLKGGPDAAAYCAAKGGIVNLTRAMAIDHGPAGIRVNCVCQATPIPRFSGARRCNLERTWTNSCVRRLLAPSGVWERPMTSPMPCCSSHRPCRHGLPAPHSSWTAEDSPD